MNRWSVDFDPMCDIAYYESGHLTGNYPLVFASTHLKAGHLNINLEIFKLLAIF